MPVHNVINDAKNQKHEYISFRMYSYELEQVLKQYMRNGKVDKHALIRDAIECFNTGKNHEACILCSAQEFIELYSKFLWS